MHTYAKGILFLSLFTATMGCSSFEKMKGTLTKSEDKSSTFTAAEHEDYVNSESEEGRSPWISSDSTEVVTDLAPAAKSAERAKALADTSKRTGEAYTRSYDLGTVASPAAPVAPMSPDGSLQAYNQKLVDQYKQMDQLGEVVLYEINVIDKTWSQYAQQYKMASANERDQLARELNRLDDNKLVLYKAYTRIYKQGKEEWPAVKSEVEKTLLSVRGLK